MTGPAVVAKKPANATGRRSRGGMAKALGLFSRKRCARSGGISPAGLVAISGLDP